jgi:hypothetical protein
MLRMGFIDDVQWILEHTPATRQTALFSATMSDTIRRVARTHMREPREVKIKASTRTVEAIRQLYWQVSGTNKIDALTRILEVEEDLDAALVFVRTKTATAEIAERLEARGYAAAALNGDMNQQMRERVIEQLKSGALDTWWPPTWRPEVSTWTASATWSTTTSPTTPRPTCTASGAPAAPGARAPRSCSSRRARSACCAPSSA